ncbi:hypothetical protein LOK49_LG01G01112 [Camellia lanceoleosa]|uniref:Uncharacterized protein n=1 Tax=Camellia lanceoleosa TaxID=1840588 RepID=A0ACC0J2S9_9ERIC|nr:hypothetical protein LOK49_LG01G01112 [Camellia lanceoleosa]
MESLVEKLCNCFSGVTMAKNGEESAESDIVEDETDADVSDPSVEGMDQSSHDVSKSKVELDEHSQASSEVTELDPCENEVQSPMTAIHLRGTSKSKAKKSSMKVRRGLSDGGDCDDPHPQAMGFNQHHHNAATVPFSVDGSELVVEKK